MEPGWRLPSQHPVAWTQGLVAGALFAFFPLVMEVAMAGFGMLVWGPVFLLILLLPVGWVVDIARTRRTADWRLSALLGIPLFGLYAFMVVAWFSEAPMEEELVKALMPLVALGLAADRLAAHGRLVWRDRALAAAVGLVATWPITTLVSDSQTLLATLVAWAALVALLPVRLPRSTRIVAVLLAALPTLTMGGALDPGLLRWGLQWAAFLGYATASAWVLVSRGQGPGSEMAAEPPPVPTR